MKIADPDHRVANYVCAKNELWERERWELENGIYIIEDKIDFSIWFFLKGYTN